MPRIASACASASSASLATLIPPALPRPPIWTWALTTTGKPSSSAACAGLLGVVARAALGHGHAVLGEQLLALVLEQVHVSFRPPGALGARSRAGRRGRYQQSPEAEALASTQEHRFRQPRGLRHPDRLGDRHLQRLPEGGRARTASRSTGPADPALPREAARRSCPAPTSCTPRSCGARRSRSPRSWDGSWSRCARASCRTASRRGRRSGTPTRCSTGCEEVLQADSTGHGIGLISNIDDKLLGATRRHLRTDFDLVVTAQQVRSYKPDPAHFKEAKRRIGDKHEVDPHRDRPRDRRASRA